MILGLLFKHGKISSDEYDEATAKPVQMFKPVSSPPRVGSFIEMVKQRISMANASDNTPASYMATSMDVVLQTDLEASLRKLGEVGQQGHAIVVNPKSGSLLAYVTPMSDRWDGSGGNLGLFAPMALVPAFTPQKVNDPLYTLASQIASSNPNHKSLAFAEAFRTDREELIRKIIEVIGADKVVNSLREFRIDAKVVDGSKVLIEPMDPL